MPEQTWNLDDLPKRLYTTDEVRLIVVQARAGAPTDTAAATDAPWRGMLAAMEAENLAQMRDTAERVLLAFIGAHVNPLKPEVLVPLAWTFAEAQEAEAEKREKPVADEPKVGDA